MSLIKDTHSVRGRVIIAQEQTFRLVTDEGHTLLLTLSVHGKTDAAELVRLVTAGASVQVEYRGQPGFDSGVAIAVRPV